MEGVGKRESEIELILEQECVAVQESLVMESHSQAHTELCKFLQN